MPTAQLDLAYFQAPLNALEQTIGPLVDAFVKAGHRFYVVGGWVRNLLVAGYPALLTEHTAPNEYSTPTEHTALTPTEHTAPTEHSKLIEYSTPTEHTALLTEHTAPTGLSGLNALGDIDVTTDARPPEIIRLLSDWATTVWTSGIAFGTVGGRRGQHTVEITTHRGELYQATSRKPAVEFSDDIETDLGRRDFTINALAIELPGRRLVDLYDGFGDLIQRVLRTPDDPARLFGEDPLRILRAARFVATLGLRPDPSVVAAMASTCERLSIVSAERISMELQKLLSAPQPGAGLALLSQTGVLAHLGITRPASEPVVPVPRLTPSDTAVPASMTAVPASMSDAVDAVPADAHRTHEIRWAVLAHLGGHDTHQFRNLLRSLRYSGEVCNHVASILAALHALGEASEEASALVSQSAPQAELVPIARRLLADHSDFLGDATVASTALVANATAITTPDLHPRLIEVLRAVETAEPIPRLGTPLNGNAVVEVAGRHGIRLEGPQIGAALGFLLECHIAEGPLSVERAESLLNDHLHNTN